MDGLTSADLLPPGYGAAPRPALSIRNLTHDFVGADGTVAPVLNHLDIAVGPGEIVAIVGRSGAGKSTLFNIISGLLTPRAGQVEIAPGPDGGPGRVGYMLQKDLLLPWRSVLDNALLGVELCGGRPPGGRQSGRQGRSLARRAAAEAMLARYGLAGQLRAYPHSLSGGQRQRVALTRTLLVAPSVLLLVEPFSALDYETRLRLEDDVLALRGGQGMSVVLVTHDIDEAIAMSDRVIVLGGRPARVREDIAIRLTLDGPRDAVGARAAPEFRAYHKQIWAALKAPMDAPMETARDAPMETGP